MLTFTYRIGRGVYLKFSGKPEDRVRSMLKANGFRWFPALQEWGRSRVSGAADFIGALEKAIGPRKPDGECWVCKSPEGYFRNRGAASPVWCDGCLTAMSAPPSPDRFDLDYEDRCREACGL